MNYAPEDVVSFKIPEKSILETKGKTFGRIFGNYVYKNDSDLIMTGQFNKKNVSKIDFSKIVKDWFLWDTMLDSLRSQSTFLKKLVSLKELGCDKSVEVDFSVWYQDSLPVRLSAIYCANKRTKDLVDMGFKIIVNGNMITEDTFEINDYYLPAHIPSIIFDHNHALHELRPEKEYNALKKLYQSGRTIDSIIFLTSKNNVNYAKKIMALATSKGTEHQFLYPNYLFYNQFNKAPVLKENLISVKGE